MIYLNNFFNNGINAQSSANNYWRSPEPIIYRYKSHTFANYLGNHWGDYTGLDSNRDGIGDTPYNIGSVSDEYPLISQWESYRITNPCYKSKDWDAEDSTTFA